MLDYKSIIIKRYALKMSYKELAEEFSASKSGINDVIRAFEKCEKLSYPLPEGITNYAISCSSRMPAKRPCDRRLWNWKQCWPGSTGRSKNMKMPWSGSLSNASRFTTITSPSSSNPE